MPPHPNPLPQGEGIVSKFLFVNICFLLDTKQCTKKSYRFLNYTHLTRKCQQCNNIVAEEKEMIMSAKETIKILLVKRNMTVKTLAEKLSIEKNKTYSRQNLSNKINRSTINYDEMEEIAKILGYRIVFEDIEGK